MATNYDLRHSFAAFVWALGARGETKLAINPADFDSYFTAAWKRWLTAGDAPAWPGRPRFSLYDVGRRPQDVLRDADRWQRNSPVDSRWVIRQSSGRDYDDALNSLIRGNPELGTSEAWLSLADNYLTIADARGAAQ